MREIGSVARLHRAKGVISFAGVACTWEAQVQLKVPRRAEDIDVAWMEAALDDHLNGARIERVEARRLTDPGQTSEAIDVAVSFSDEASPLPKRYIAKIGSNDPDVLAVTKVFGHYSREV